ncbi:MULTISPECIES: chemotaxis protein CheA [unclassified Tolypothrix]|uniref:chemotaxis protein CheA n=1 Tax=unclassified Tolypothrix TaxID=2649714 RepID=UPI0005EAC514|nr:MULTISPECIES: chemotaxis protein CheA [unclassified Tolypothrix]BAY95414.1 CheW-like domain protein [Microchaete diplosiphon NIES-3275]EKF00647.1 chemotaxis histidine kinase CheA [Tolypothrix sp. PCC 7601]MBE9084214.1 chemotaxis protein CheA [Tolypothrix sp. LEGE 11397]UYD28679.1 chemotaxis protein CheA [Tolypothrix sp. PCC 7712]UYD35407.1 chemotaxis protein CheA [Tolypothrix sp. PCC 7601]
MELTEIDDDIEAFLVESYENLDQIERDIIELEKEYGNGESLVRIYRSLHTLKGNCGFLPFPKLEALAHAAESLLSSLRERTLAITPQIVSTLLQTIDSIRQMLSAIATTRKESDRDYAQLIEKITALQQTQPAATSPAPPTVEFDGDLEDSTQTTSESHIRVNVGLLDQVMNLVGELVLARNQVMRLSTKLKDSDLTAACQRLNGITGELQEQVMKTRLQPINSIWQKFPRVVRDLAIASGKQVAVEMAGIDTELDKSIIEAIKDPLTHLIRNCVDHGIEFPAERTAKGKPAVGRLFLGAAYENGKVNLEISDDGRGLNPERLKARSQQLGLVSATQAATMTDSEAMNLIFLRGFSTAEQITNLSGRGVGMDIVKDNIEKINGSIEIESQLGQGTTFKLKIPLTLAIISALIISSGGDFYAIPQGNLQELVRLETEPGLKNIEIFYDVPVYRLRGELIPLIYLNQILQISTTNSELLSIVIIQADNYRFGLVVDSIEDIQEIVVKPLGKQLKHISLFAGATILGDGKVGLIIDVVGLAKQAGVSATYQQLANATDVSIPESDRQTLLLFTGPQDAHMGIPLAIASRLAEIPATAIEKVANQLVVRYDKQILPLIDLHTIFGDRTFDNLAIETETLSIIIVSPYPAVSVALVVDHILDIVEEALTIKGIPSREGILFSTVIQGKITEILDMEAIIRKTNPYLLQLVNSR